MFEKLLLHILIVIFPVLVYNFFSEMNHREETRNSPYFCGLLQSLSAILCMSFPLEAYGFQWDLRYVPLILSMFYMGPKAGVLVAGSILGYQTIIGSDNLLLEYIGSLVAAALPLLAARKFWTLSPGQRQLMIIAVSGAIGIYSILVLNTVIFVRQGSFSFEYEASINVLMFEGIQILGAWLAAFMNEQTIERYIMSRKIQQAEKLNILHELAASVAHEIRNPLTVVKGFLQLNNERKGEYNQEYTQLILSELGRAESIINDYLNFAKPEMKKIEPLNLSEIVNETVMLLNAYALQVGVTIESELEEGVFVFTDKGQLKQALVNLLKNAVEACVDGGNVQVSVASKGHQAVICVSDNGKGMSKEQLARLGTLFYTTKDRGTGLGTKVSIRIIESMGGKITFSSKPGSGTEAVVTLPLNLQP